MNYMRINSLKKSMIIKKISFWLLVLFLVAAGQPVRAAAPLPNGDDLPLCPPETYWQLPEDCLPAGPVARLQERLASGVPFPEPAIPIYKPDPDLPRVPYLYFRVDDPGTALYPTLADAEAKSGASRVLEDGLVYVTYISRVDTGHGVYYQLPSGEWMPGNGSRVSYSWFQGFQVSSTPRYPFGWVLETIPVRSAPAYDAPVTGTLYRFDIVQAFQRQKDNYDNEWVLIGPQQWIEGRKVGLVIPNPTPPEGVTGDRWIEVNLEEQTLAVYDGGRMVFATLVATGVEPFWTQPGLFQIYEKKETENMSGAFEPDRSDYYYLQNVPWTMYYDQARALHGAYWHTNLGYPQSHGCVNLSVGDAHWLYDWAQVGDWVWVHDPSGRTPTDPSLYGAGGA